MAYRLNLRSSSAAPILVINRAVKKNSMPSYKKLIKRWSREKEDQKARSAVFKKQLLENGTPVFKRFNLQVVYLFGSVASGKSRESSDIDLYVSSLPADRYWQFRHELEEAVHLPIDLYTDSDDLKFIKKIIERGEKIYPIVAKV